MYKYLILLFPLFVWGQTRTQVDWNTQIKNPPFLSAITYNFPPQSCNALNTCVVGGSTGAILGAGNNSVILTPVPIGLNANDAHHYLYVSGGTGTAEWCLIVGGTATSGQALGGVIINCANSHSGAFTLSSGSAGIYEAANSLSNGGDYAIGVGGVVRVQPGTLTVCNLWLPFTNLTLQGSGIYATVLNCSVANIPVVTLFATGIIVQDLTVSHTGTSPTAGGNGIVTTNGGCDNLLIQRINAIHNWDGFFLSLVSTSWLRDSFAASNQNDGFTIDPNAISTQWDIFNIVSTLNGGNGMTINPASGVSYSGGPRIHKMATYANGGPAVEVITTGSSTVNGTSIIDSFFGGDNSSEIFWDANGQSNQITQVSVEDGGQTGGTLIGYPAVAASSSMQGAGLYIAATNTTTVAPLIVTGFSANNNAWSGIEVYGTGVVINGCSSTNNGIGAMGLVHQNGLTISGPGAQVSGCYFSNSNGTQTYGLESFSTSLVGLGANSYDPTTYTRATAFHFDGPLPPAYAPLIPAYLPQAFGAGCATSGSVGAVCTTAYTLATAFQDTNYNASCMITGITSGVPIVQSAALTSGTTLTIQFAALTASAAQASTVSCILMHN